MRYSAKIKKLDLINNLINYGFIVHEISQNPCIYSINGKRVNIRTKSKSRSNKENGSRILWFDIRSSVIEVVDYFLYQMLDENSFILIPSSFLKDAWERLYISESYSPEKVRNFDIHWDDLYLAGYDKYYIGSFYSNLKESEGYFLEAFKK